MYFKQKVIFIVQLIVLGEAIHTNKTTRADPGVVPCGHHKCSLNVSPRVVRVATTITTTTSDPNNNNNGRFTSESTSSILSQLNTRMTELNTKALATLALTIIIFTLLFLPSQAFRLVLIECSLFAAPHTARSDDDNFHRVVEVSAFVAALAAFSLHPLLVVAADKNLKSEINKTMRHLMAKLFERRSTRSRSVSRKRKKIEVIVTSNHLRV